MNHHQVWLSHDNQPQRSDQLDRAQPQASRVPHQVAGARAARGRVLGRWRPQYCVARVRQLQGRVQGDVSVRDAHELLPQGRQRARLQHRLHGRLYAIHQHHRALHAEHELSRALAVRVHPARPRRLPREQAALQRERSPPSPNPGLSRQPVRRAAAARGRRRQKRDAHGARQATRRAGHRARALQQDPGRRAQQDQRPAERARADTRPSRAYGARTRRDTRRRRHAQAQARLHAAAASDPDPTASTAVATATAAAACR